MGKIIATIVVLLGAIAIYVVERRRKIKILRERPHRELLDDVAIYDRFYSGSGLSKDDVVSLWHEIAEEMGVPSGALRPSDVFGKDIGAGLITTPELDSLYRRGLKRVIELGIECDLEKLQTVDNYVTALARKE